MTLLDEILSTTGSPKPCIFGQWIGSLPADQQVEVRELLLHPKLSSLKIKTFLEAKYPDFHISYATFSRHRRQVTGNKSDHCECP